MIYGANRASSTLATAITNVATTIAINAGDAGKFPTPVGGGWFPLVIVDTSGNLEIVKCTARAASNLTVVRGQEGTAALAFSAGSRVELRLTKGAFEGIQDEAAASVSALTLIVASKADATALAAEAALARNASSLNTGIVPHGVMPVALRNAAYNGFTDWDDCLSNGWYMSSTASNAPIGGGVWFIGQVEAHAPGWVTQTVHCFAAATSADTIAYRRHKQGGTWNAWYKLQLSQVEQDARYAKLSGATFTSHVNVDGSLRVGPAASSSRIVIGSTAIPGYASLVEFYKADGNRKGYMGWDDGYGNSLVIVADGANGIALSGAHIKFNGVNIATEAYVAAQIAANPSQLNQNLAYGAVGQYIFASCSIAAVTGVIEGSTYAGSSLVPAGIYAAAHTADTTGVASHVAGSTALSGTWLALGRARNSATGAVAPMTTLFVRIS